MIAELTNRAPTRAWRPDLRRLNLTRAHLREGVPGDDNLCAVAIGLLDTLGLPVGFARVTVTEHAIDLHFGEVEQWWAVVPDDMADFIEQFDQTEEDADLLRVMMTGAALGLYQFDLSWHHGQSGDDG